jgi:hypothetical protein
VKREERGICCAREASDQGDVARPLPTFRDVAQGIESALDMREEVKAVRKVFWVARRELASNSVAC